MKVAVIGCGSIGKRYAEWLRDMKLEVGVFDLDLGRLESLNNIRKFGSLCSLIEWGPEKAVIATPPLHHCEPAIQLLENNLELLIEKPIAASISQGKKILQRARSRSKTIWVVCNMRYHPAIKTMRSNLSAIGRPLCVRSYFSHRLSQMRPSETAVYAASTNEGGGVILDCIHEFDYIQEMLGPIRKTRGWGGQIGDDRIQADDVADIQLEFANGCHGIIHFDFLSRLKKRGLEIIGTDATLVWQSVGRNPEKCEVVIGDNERIDTLYESRSVDPWISYHEMLDRFINNKPGMQNGEEAIASLKAAIGAAKPNWTKL